MNINKQTGIGIIDKKSEIQAAMRQYRAQLKKDPNHLYANASMGVLLMQNSTRAEGLAYLNKAASLAATKNDSSTLFDLGNTLFMLRQPAEAIDCFRQVLLIAPDHTDAHCKLGIALQESGWLKEAETSFRRALDLDPEHLETRIALGVVLRSQGRLSESAANYMQALRSHPDNAQLHFNLGITLQLQLRWTDAEASFRSTLHLDPDFADAHCHLAATLKSQRKLQEAQASYRRALQLDPGSYQALFNLGTVLLATGQFAEGWKKFEHRWQGAASAGNLPRTVIPQWKGETPKPADSILIFQEQGFGDRIQFARYLKLVRSRFFGKVSVVCHRQLTNLFQRSFPGCEFLPAAPDDQRSWQWQCPIMSLPLAFKTKIGTIPADVPYLIPGVDLVSQFSEKLVQLGLPPHVKKIGIVWKTGSAMPNAALRSVQFNQLACFFSHSNIVWFSLQKEPGADREKMRAVSQLIDWSDQFDNFDDTAALIMHLDLVITVDTAVAHLAGALGKKVWLLNRYESEWRWMHDRQDSLWYPTMQIFTQRNPGDWDELIKRADALLAKSVKRA